MNSSAKWCFSYPLTSQRSEGSKQLRRMQITQPCVSKGGNTFAERREYFCLNGGAVTMGHSRGHEMWLERWATREMLASDLCGSQYIWVSVLSQGPRKEKRQIICSWRLNTNSAWGEPQFAQTVQFLKLCFFQYATILAAACLGTLHTQHRDILFYSSAWAVPLCVCCQWPFPPIYMVATRRGDSWHISAMTYQPPHLHLGPGSLSSPHKHFMLRVMKASRWLKAY